MSGSCLGLSHLRPLSSYSNQKYGPTTTSGRPPGPRRCYCGTMVCACRVFAQTPATAVDCSVDTACRISLGKRRSHGTGLPPSLSPVRSSAGVGEVKVRYRRHSSIGFENEDSPSPSLSTVNNGLVVRSKSCACRRGEAIGVY